MTEPLIDERVVRIGVWIKLPILESIEIASIAGYDFVVIDLEHSALTTQVAGDQIALARAARIPALVRVPLSARSDVARLLDAGAAGIVFPHVESTADAAEIVRLCRFPPVGERGAGPTSRAGQWGLADLDEYLAPAGQPLSLVAQIETAHAVANAASIAAVAGIDALLIGQLDLSISMGTSATAAEIDRLVAAVEAIPREGVALGTAAGHPNAVQSQLDERGYRFIIVGSDATMLATAAVESVRSIRRRLDHLPRSDTSDV